MMDKFDNKCREQLKKILLENCSVVGKISLIAGRPGSGKTTVAMNLAYQKSIMTEKKVLFITFESSKEQVIDFYKNMMLVDKPDNLIIEDNCKNTVEDIMNICSEMKDDLEMVIIDYVQLISSSKDFDNRLKEEDYISFKLVSLTGNTSIHLVLLSQLPRVVKDGIECRPSIEIYKSIFGYIQLYADNILYLYSDIFSSTQLSDEREFILAKHEGGPLFNVKYKFARDKRLFSDDENNNYEKVTVYKNIEGIARIGYTKKDREVYVVTDDKGDIPHFHYKKSGFGVPIMILKPEYYTFKDEEETSSYKKHFNRIFEIKKLDQDDINDLIEFLNNKPYLEKKCKSNWEFLICEWNRNNDGNLDEDISMPDYKKLLM